MHARRGHRLDPAREVGSNSGMDIGTWLFTAMRGRRVGADAAGNVYYTEKAARAGYRRRRWVAYKGRPEASAVPAEWHAWLHYMTDDPLPDTGKRPWQKPHQANPTGTEARYRPPGHAQSDGKRPAAAGDYESWTPGS